VQSLLLECGPTLAGAFLRAGVLDKLLVFVAPKLVGGDDAPPLFAGPGVRSMADALSLSGVEVERVGEDLLISGYVNEP
jgi:diaminohydroxyphosphoribosylaminopyrimidine deaminase / 5-amino-6-(5-phosphoribosylamino)uracil reductase